MTSAAGLSLEECRDAPRRTEVRQRLHDRLEHWLQPWENQGQEPNPPVEELTQAVLALRQELTQAVTEGLVAPAPRTAREQRTVGGPPGGQVLSARGPQERTVETVGGAIRLRRPSCSGAPCPWGRTPLEAGLGLTTRRQQPDVQQAAIQVTRAGPYETACEVFAALTGWPLRAHTAHEVSRVGAEGWPVLDVAPSREEVVAKSAAVAMGQPGRPILVLAMDGADVPTRPETAQGRRPGRKQARAQRARWTGAWRDAKGVRFSLIAADRMVQGLRWPQVHTDEETAEALRHLTAAGLIPEARGRLGGMAEGARWIWTQARARFASAVEIWDSDHGREPVSQVAARPDGAHPERQQAWCEAARARLLSGEVPGVSGGLQRLQPTDAPAAPEIALVIASLQRHQERRDDRLARQGGYPMGSGGIASAHTFICPGRLKRAGAWWYVTTANQRLALRCAKDHGPFDRVFARYRQRIRDQPGSIPAKKQGMLPGHLAQRW
jgi:hypothetical protein